MSQEPMQQEAMDDAPDAIAVVGMSLRVPGAGNLDEFWRNLVEGVCSISSFTAEELLAAGVDPEALADRNYVKARGVLDGADLFDAGLFGLTPREAETTDPQHRVFLEQAWAALEHAGYHDGGSGSYEGAVGVFVGSNVSSYLIHNLAPNRDLVRRIGPLQLRIRNDKDFLATQASYKLNLKGPGVNVQTACSSSLVGVCLACHSLLAYQCDMALAGGVSVTAPPRSGYLQQEGVYAPDGRCRAFDAGATGTVLGDGVAVVVLKRLTDALADGDTIHAVIRGFAINNDGSLKLDYTAPSVDGQAEVIATAHSIADVPADSITYVEAHGTGTPLGDPIEIAALTRAFEAGTDRKGFCAVGSVKTNVGHLDAAAGVTSLIKAVLALEHRRIPPSLNFERPNPHIDFAATPFYVNDRLSDWPAGEQPRRAGVSSFGVGGTNAHVVVEEAPEAGPSDPSRPWQLLTLAAKTPTALDQMARDLAAFLGRDGAEAGLADVAWTLAMGRRPLPHRRTLVCRDAAEAVALLQGAQPRRVLSGFAPEADEVSVAFLFPGIGDQYVGMGRGLYEAEPVFRDELDRCARLLRPHLGLDFREALFAAGGPERAGGEMDLRRLLGRGEEAPEASSPLDRTALLHPVLFAVEHALARLWMSWGVRPRALIGYSIGEYVAACLAGVFSLEDALRLVAERARIIDALPQGAMLAVPLPETELSPLLGGDLSLAAVNGPAFCVAAGPVEAVAGLERRLGERGVVCRRLKAVHAFHSRMLEPALGDFRAVAARIALAPPSIPLISNVSGTWLTAAEATDPGYWAAHMCRTVRFGDGLRELCREGRRVLLEVGPGNALSSIAAQVLEGEDRPAAVPSLPHAHDPEPDQAFALNALGRLWLAGLTPDWKGYFQGERRRRVPLPTYPFERRRYWIDPPRQQEREERAAASGASLARRELADWFYLPVWKQSRRPALPPSAEAAEAGEERPWLVFLDAQGLGERLAQRLERRGRWVLRVTAAAGGAGFAAASGGRFTLDPARPGDYDALVRELAEENRLPGTVLHLWSLDGPDGGAEPAAELQDLGFFSLLSLAQAWGERAAARPLRIVALSPGLHAVTGEEALAPQKATLLGPCRVIPQEYPAIACRNVDLPAASAALDEGWDERLLAELERTDGEPVVALRGVHRWVQAFEAARLDSPGERTRLRRGGVYLITGGTGGIGLTLARHLAASFDARLVLVSRTALPPREAWAERSRGNDRLAARLRGLLEIEALGAEPLVLAADVTDEVAMAAVREAALARFGCVDGILHAAGVSPGGLIQLKDREAAAAVLAPKVRGTLVLHRVFGRDPLDFVVLCSSLTAVTGNLGLVDHCAANAFLDAWAHRQAARGDHATLSLAWDTWLEVGQAAEAGMAARLEEVLDEAEPHGIHPLLGRLVEESGSRRVYASRLDLRHWVLAEHRFQGRGLLPGTAYLEMVRAAVAENAPGRPVHLRDVLFSRPLVVGEGEVREVRTILEGSRFRVVSRPSSGGAEEEHVRGSAEVEADAAAAPVVPPAVPSPGGDGWTDRLADLARHMESAGVDLGPRWRGLPRELRCGEREGWARLALPAELRSDLDALGLHPALLDAATGVARVLGGGVYLPLEYRSLLIRGPLPAEVQCRFRLTGEAAADGETLVCDVSVLDAAGHELVAVAGYTLRRLSAEAAAGLAAAGAQAGSATAAPAGGTAGILPAEGGEVLARVLTRGLDQPQVLASTRDLEAVVAQIRSLTSERLGERMARQRTGAAVHPRPHIQTPFEAPRTPLEERLAGLFQEMLGLDRVGIHDNFFDLGGNSLVATQLISRLREEMDVALTLRALFESPTVAELGVLVVRSQAEQVDENDLAAALAELRGLSGDELARLLAEERAQS